MQQFCAEEVPEHLQQFEPGQSRNQSESCGRTAQPAEMQSNKEREGAEHNLRAGAQQAAAHCMHAQATPGCGGVSAAYTMRNTDRQQQQQAGAVQLLPADAGQVRVVLQITQPAPTAPASLPAAGAEGALTLHNGALTNLTTPTVAPAVRYTCVHDDARQGAADG